MPGPEPPRPADAAGRSGFAWPAWVLRTRDTSWRIVVSTVGSSMRYRVTGLAAEAAFFTVLSVPPLIFALAGAIGYVTESFSPDQVEHVRNAIVDLAARFLTDSAVDKVIQPTIDDVLKGGRFDVISVGFVLALWSGSRAMHVFVDTITIMHGLSGHRGIVKTRAMSFSLYLLAIVTGVIALPLAVAGPRLIHRWLPDSADFLVSFYWPAVLIASIFFESSNTLNLLVLLVALILSSVASIFLLADLRNKLALNVQQRAERMTERLEESRRAEDID